MPEPTPKHFAIVRSTVCDVCRRRRRRCDGRAPACGSCTKGKMGNRCTYGVEPCRPNVKSLQDRITELEKNIRLLEDGQSVASTPSNESEPWHRQPIQIWTPLQTTNLRDDVRKWLGETPLPKPRTPQNRHIPGPLDVPSSLRDPLVGFMRQEDVPMNIRDHLIDAFIRNRWLWLGVHVPRFRDAYNHPPSHPESIHPALLDAMCMIGCLHSRSVFHIYAPLFYQKLQASLLQNLSHSHKFHDFIRASFLLGRYCLVKKRLLQGQHHISTTARFAIACGFHKLDSFDLGSYSTAGLLPPPKDAIDLGERIRTFWAIWCADSIASMVLKSPAAIPHDGSVTTMWPCEYKYYENGQARHGLNNNLASLYNPVPVPGPLVADVYENAYAFNAKSYAVHRRIHTLVESSRNGAEITPEEIDENMRAATSLLHAIEIYWERSYTPARCRDPYLNGYNISLALANSFARSCLIMLYNLLMEKDPGYHAKRLDLARSMLKLARDVCATRTLHLLLWIPWMSAYEVLARELAQLTTEGDTTGAAATQHQIELFYKALKTLPDAVTFQTDWQRQNLNWMTYVLPSSSGTASDSEALAFSALS
ncbi:hypothetical protein BOTBODRAFT_184119 [Botryobasidium botryosum FD-172 SS1]|uniref:Zn(2)-C6 fungal-type domain-containing protein n=1 Tax=Botryobasidium botryosum (strain FD-172 SS1) TaxID=930990 RepID=A0A067N8M8_BOTB1|nr:hypothetical protein BOTBODRAFT_184119 [Botryobasidium botryosum FD-172 SS1]